MLRSQRAFALAGGVAVASAGQALLVASPKVAAQSAGFFGEALARKGRDWGKQKMPKFHILFSDSFTELDHALMG